MGCNVEEAWLWGLSLLMDGSAIVVIGVMDGSNCTPSLICWADLLANTI